MAGEGDEGQSGAKKHQPQCCERDCPGLSCFTFAMFTLLNISLILSVFGAPFSPAALPPQAGWALAGTACWSLRR
jgi:hypothetical protein